VVRAGKERLNKLILVFDITFILSDVDTLKIRKIFTSQQMERGYRYISKEEEIIRFQKKIYKTIFRLCSCTLFAMQRR
jgi:hypothetical protein